MWGDHKGRPYGEGSGVRGTGGSQTAPRGRMSSGTGFTPIPTFPHQGGRDLQVDGTGYSGTAPAGNWLHSMQRATTRVAPTGVRGWGDGRFANRS